MCLFSVGQHSYTIINQICAASLLALRTTKIMNEILIILATVWLSSLFFAINHVIVIFFLTKEKHIVLWECDNCTRASIIRPSSRPVITFTLAFVPTSSKSVFVFPPKNHIAIHR